MALILNIETSADVCSVALAEDGKTIALQENKEGRAHSASIMKLIQNVLRESKYKLADLQAIAVSFGPGSYTGLRIGTATAKGLCYSLNMPLIGINTLMIIAATQISKYQNDTILICPVIDARRMEVYMSLYDTALNIIIPPVAEIVDENFLCDYLDKSKIIVTGNAVNKIKQVIDHSNILIDNDFKFSAIHMAPCSEQAFSEKRFENTAYFEPFYLKSPVIY